MKKIKNSDITAYLKITDRPGHTQFVLKNLNFWVAGLSRLGIKYVISLGTFKDSIQLEYSPIETIDNSYFIHNVIGADISKRVNDSIMEESWRPAGRVHSLPFAHAKTPYVISIDADDIWHSISADEYLDRALRGFESVESDIMSQDFYMSVSLRPKTRPHHWSLGINLAETAKAWKIVKQALTIKPPDAGWCNIDYLVDYWLEKNAKYPIGMTATNGCAYHSLIYQYRYFSEDDTVEMLYAEKTSTRLKRFSRVILI